jgi:hypothetical protein
MERMKGSPAAVVYRITARKKVRKAFIQAKEEFQGKI